MTNPFRLGAVPPTVSTTMEIAALSAMSAWAPLQHPIFRAVWVATIAANADTSDRQALAVVRQNCEEIS